MEESAAGRLVGVLTAPRKTFEAIASRPTWLVALVVLAVVGAAAVWVGFARLAPEEFARSMREQMEARGQTMPATMDVDKVLAVTRWSSVIGALLVSPIVYLVTAALFLVIFRLAGSELDFRRSLSVTVHGLLPFGLAALIGIPVALAKEGMTMEELQGGGFLMSHLGFLAGEDASTLVKALLSSVDLFSIWCIVLLVIGFEVVGKMKRGAAIGGVAAVWGIGLLLKIGMAALRG